MAIIKPISDLRNKTQNISKLVHENNEPVFITKNGEGDMVVMSIAHYRFMQKEFDIHKKLLEAETRKASGEKPQDSKIVLKRLRDKLSEKKEA